MTPPQDLELSVPSRLEKYSGKLVKLGRAVERLAAAGKKVRFVCSELVLF